ncbi:phosphotriesterase [Streptomyces sp. MST-110588]|uniref:phosphotriesterase family protein n=1 Tax=Streptomyces sp. MST-110588 TaxID=2833628 RepID=UPI001F5D8664|nr:phosphotriesterase [Streptomyces sp. MST-110588]
MSRAATVRTVLGDLAPEALGVTDAHDHLFLRSPVLAGQELDDAGAAEAELRAFRAAGGGTVVQWTPYGMGRRAAELPRLSRATGVHVVAATGLHQAVHYPAALLKDIGEDLASLFVAELTQGIGSTGNNEGSAAPGNVGVTADSAATGDVAVTGEFAVTGPRAGMIKVAGGFHGLDAHARYTMTAAAEAHHVTGAAIGVHLELGTGAADVLELLCDKLGVRPDRVILGHLNRSPDLTAHQEVARTGAYLAFDGPSRSHHATDWRLPDALAALADAGYADRLLLGGDTTTAGARSVNGGPGMPYLLRRLRRRLSLTLDPALVERVLTVNPGRAFAAEWPPGAGGEE